MYAATKEELDTATSNILKESNTYPEFVARFEKFYKRKSEWVLLFRRDLLMRQNNTNNYAEISIRILKDIVLCHTKAFNVVALCDFCISVWELYLVKRLLDYAYERKDEVALLYTSLLRKIINFNENDFEKRDNSTYKIQNGDKTYIIDTDIGACTCPAGISGAFCKHQCFLMHLKKISLPNAPPITQEDHHELAMLALGPIQCPEMNFLGEFKKAEEENEICSISQSSDRDDEKCKKIMPNSAMATEKQK